MAPGKASSVAPTATEDSSGSFVLLTSHEGHRRPSTALPPPRYLWPLKLVTALDFLYTAIVGLPLAWTARTGLWIAVVLSLARPMFLFFAVLRSVRIRSRSAWVLGSMLVSALVLLYHINELVQYSSPSPAPIPLPPTQLPAPSRPSSALATTTLPSLPFIPSRNTATAWYLFSFLFSVVEYGLFAVFVGVRQRRNPFVNRRRISVGGRRASGWGEQRWEGTEERVRAPLLETDPLLSPEGSDDGEEEADSDFSGTDDESVGSSDDEDAILDIPRRGGRPSLRSRKSTASFLMDEEGGSRSREPGEGLTRSSSNYGTITNLAGI